MRGSASVGDRDAGGAMYYSIYNTPCYAGDSGDIIVNVSLSRHVKNPGFIIIYVSLLSYRSALAV